MIIYINLINIIYYYNREDNFIFSSTPFKSNWSIPYSISIGTVR